MEANAAVRELAAGVNADGGLGTTLVAVVVAGHSLYWISAGDSRLYLFRQGRMTRITQDHNYAGWLREAAYRGDVAPDAAELHPGRDALTSYLGQAELEKIDRNVRSYPLEAGDWLLLCSDGLHGMLSEAEIGAELVGEPQDAAERLILRTLEKKHPHQDNVSAVILAC